MTKLITIWDTSVGTLNVGDEIINEAVKRELGEIYKDGHQFVTVPTHDVVGRRGRLMMKRSEAIFVAGTNILSSKYKLFRINGWNLKLRDAFFVKGAVLLGAGWQNYQGHPSLLNSFFYKRILNKAILHSVRDNYTKEKLESIGIKNVVNTGCPTLWKLTPEHCQKIPHQKGKKVITTISDYSTNVSARKADEEMLQTLNENYEEVFVWLQGAYDEDYFDSFDPELTKKIIKIPGLLQRYDQFLEENEDTDFIGTRLHAGIRAMQKFRRSIIIGIDNRAIEMKKDYGLPVLERENIDLLDKYINSNFETKIGLNFELIQSWKDQFEHE